jgi:hypothetical protein
MRQKILLTSIVLVVATMLLSSCNSIGLLSEKNSWLLDDIDSFGDFIKVYFVLQLSIILIGVFLGFFLGKGGYIVALILHFIWIVSYRDYGFFIVLLLFGLFSIISFLISTLNIFRRNKY